MDSVTVFTVSYSLVTWAIRLSPSTLQPGVRQIGSCMNNSWATNGSLPRRNCCSRNWTPFPRVAPPLGRAPPWSLLTWDSRTPASSQQPRSLSRNGKNLVPSGKRLHNYGKSQFLMGKLTIKWPCSIAMLVYQRVNDQLILWKIIKNHHLWFRSIKELTGPWLQ